MEEIIISHVIKNFFGNLYNKKSKPEIQIEMFKPKDLKDAEKITDSLLEGVPVIVNFEDTDAAKVKQITDFIRGKAFYAGCQIEQINENVFIFTPENIKVAAVN